MNRILANNKLYEVKRVYKRNEFTDLNKLIRIKNNNNFDALIQNDDFYLMCNEISEAEFIELKNEELIELNTKLNSELNNEVIKNDI